MTASRFGADLQSARKKICFVATIEMAVEAYLLDHIKAMMERYDITVVVKMVDPRFLESLAGRVAVVPVDIERKISVRNDILALWRLIAIFRKERYDMVHSICPKAGLLAMFAAFVARVPMRVHTFTGQIWATKKGPSRWFFKKLDRLLSALATGILVDSDSQKAFLVGEGVVRAQEACVLARGSMQGVDIRRFCPNPSFRREVRRRFRILDSEILFLFLGRMNRDKGLLDLTAAFVEAHRVGGNLRLMFVGPDEEDMRSRIRRAAGSFENKICFEGYTRVPEKYMAGADVICLPSYREGFGSVLIEAAAVGIPAIGTRIYGIIDAVEDGHTGLLCEPGNVGALASGLARFASDTALRETMGKRAQERARRDFSKETVVGAMQDYYRYSLEGV